MTEQDPFSPQAPANQAGGTDDDDTFTTPGGGSYPKVGELLHKLLILVPVKVEPVPDRNNPGKMQERWSADTTVIETDGRAETFDSMYWSHKSIASALVKAQRDRKPVLGTLHLFPVLASKKHYANEPELLASEDIQRWLAKGTGLPPTPVAWALEPATPDELKLALAWWRANKNPFGA